MPIAYCRTADGYFTHLKEPMLKMVQGGECLVQSAWPPFLHCRVCSKAIRVDESLGSHILVRLADKRLEDSQVPLILFQEASPGEKSAPPRAIVSYLKSPNLLAF